MARAMSITSRYQVTVPKEVRDALGIQSNDGLVFNLEDGRVFVEKAPQLKDIQSRANRLMKQRGVTSVTDTDMAQSREIFQRDNLKW